MKLELKNVTKRFGQTLAMDDVCLEVGAEVQTLVLIGPSGGGKSTLLRVVAGLEVPDAGSVTIDDAPLRYGKEALLKHRRSNGFVFQSWNLFPHLTALQNVTLPLEKVHRFSEEEAVKAARTQLERFRLGDHQDKKPAQMSGGQQQRVALARAIAPNPRLLLLDEPTSALDPEMTAEVLELIEDLCRQGQNILLSTHEMGFAKAVADRIVFLAEGQVQAYAPPEDIFGGTAGPQVERFIAKVMRY